MSNYMSVNFINILTGVGLILGGVWSIYFQYKNPIDYDINLFNFRGYLFGGVGIIIGLLILWKEIIL